MLNRSFPLLISLVVTTLWPQLGRTLPVDSPAQIPDQSDSTTTDNVGRPLLWPSVEPLDLQALDPEQTPPDVLTAGSISATGLTVPSLWRMKTLYAAQNPTVSKLVETWLAYPIRNNQPGRVDMVVNAQVWSLLDYVQRYEFLNSFGLTATDFGYNLRVFDDRATFQGSYTCVFDPADLTVLQQFSSSAPLQSNAPMPSIQRPSDLNCQTILATVGKGQLRGRPAPMP